MGGRPCVISVKPGGLPRRRRRNRRRCSDFLTRSWTSRLWSLDQRLPRHEPQPRTSCVRSSVLELMREGFVCGYPCVWTCACVRAGAGFHQVGSLECEGVGGVVGARRVAWWLAFSISLALLSSPL